MVAAMIFFFLILSVQLLAMAQAEIDPYASDNVDILSYHICKKVNTGLFGAIAFKSFTWYHELGRTEPKLLIFEGAKKYYVEGMSIRKRSMTMDTHAYDWNSNEMRSASVNVTDAKDMRKVYILYWGDWKLINAWIPRIDLYENEKVRLDKTKMGALVFTEKYVFVTDIYWDGTFVGINQLRYYHGYANVFPDFAIIHDQVKGELSRGYIINRDVVDGTDDMVIYDLEVWWESLRPNIHQKGKQHPTYETSDSFKSFFYIELTGQSNQVKLVPRAVRAKKKHSNAQMFHEVPRGFRFKNDVYLFDSHRGCVHVLLNLKDSLKDHRQSFIINRVNIPYETFFSCPQLKAHVNLNLTRCDKIHGDYKGWVRNSVQAPRTDAPYHYWEDPWNAWGYLILGLVVVLIIAGAAFAYYHYYVREDVAAAGGILGGPSLGMLTGKLVVATDGKSHSSSEKTKKKKSKTPPKAKKEKKDKSKSTEASSKTLPAKKGDKEPFTSSTASFSTSENVSKSKSPSKQKKENKKHTSESSKHEKSHSPTSKKAEEKAKAGESLAAPWGGVGGPGTAPTIVYSKKEEKKGNDGGALTAPWGGGGGSSVTQVKASKQQNNELGSSEESEKSGKVDKSGGSGQTDKSSETTSSEKSGRK